MLPDYALPLSTNARNKEMNNEFLTEKEHKRMEKAQIKLAGEGVPQPIKKYIKETGSSVKEFADLVGVSKEMVYQWIARERPVSIQWALKIEEICGIDAALLNPKVTEMIMLVLNREERLFKQG